MNTDTLDKMRRMRLSGMHRAFKTTMEQPGQTYTADEMIALLIESEWDDRHNRSIERTMHKARFRYKATIEQVDYSNERGIDKNLVHRLAEGEFINRKENVLITGSTGTGRAFWHQPLVTRHVSSASKCCTPILPGCWHSSRWQRLMDLLLKS